MFCPKCGNSDQSPETYCRQCGTYLPDLSRPLVAITKPEEHVKANIVLGSMTVITSFTLALLLYLFFLGLPESPPVIYIMFGLLLAMGIWHIQTVWRSVLLRRHFKEDRTRKDAFDEERVLRSPDTNRKLASPNFDEFPPASVTDSTTRHLATERSSEP
jgi:hypothetical protein